MKFSKSQPHISLMEVPPCRPQREPSPTRTIVPSHSGHHSGPIGSIHPTLSSSTSSLLKTSSSTSKSNIVIVNMKVMHDMQPPNKKSKLGSFNRTSKNRLDRWNSGSVINGNGSFASKNKVDSIPLIPGSKRSYVPVSEMKNTLWDSTTNMSTTTPSTTRNNNNNADTQQHNDRMDIYSD